MDKNDLDLRALEKKAIKALMDHVYEYDKATGGKKTLIGMDIANENSVTHIHAVGSTVWQNPKTWAALSNFSSKQAFIDRTEWEYTINLANAVKESKYPVWTRANTFVTSEVKNLVINEYMRTRGGTSLDFVGLDPYSTSTSALYKYGHEATTFKTLTMDWSQGENLPMVMENSGAVSNAESLVLATVAGGAFYNVYELMGPDNFGLYYPKATAKRDYTPVARGAYVQDVIKTNNLLKSLSFDLSRRLPIGANGTRLAFFNPLSDGTLTSAKLVEFPVTYTPLSTPGVGIAIARNSKSLLLTSTRNANFTIADVGYYGIQSVRSGNYSSTGTFTVKASYPYTRVSNNITIEIERDVLVEVLTTRSFSVL